MGNCDTQMYKTITLRGWTCVTVMSHLFLLCQQWKICLTGRHETLLMNEFFFCSNRPLLANRQHIFALRTSISSLFITFIVIKFNLSVPAETPEYSLHIKKQLIIVGWKYRSLIFCILDTASAHTTKLEVIVEIYIFVVSLSSGSVLEWASCYLQ